MLIYQKHIRREDLRANKMFAYIFGDNLMRQGRGGQAAEMRGEPNAFGIATKKRPDMQPSAFFTDEEFELLLPKILDDIEKVKDLLTSRAYTALVMPIDGIGTGYAQMQTRAPKLFNYMSFEINNLKLYACNMV